MNTSTTAGAPTPLGVLDHLDAEHETRMISAGNTLRTRNTPVAFGVICLIDMIQREHVERAMRQGLRAPGKSTSAA